MKAIIFDLDGVICHTDEYHYLAWKAMADTLGIRFDRTVNNRLRGISRMESLDIVLEGYPGQLSPAEKEALAAQKNELYKDMLKQMSPGDLSQEVKTTLEALRDQGYLLAIGSSSQNAPFILQQLGLGSFFDAVCDGNNITRSKPDPEVFVKAAQMLCAAPEDCLVVEDAVSGALAGHAGKMKVACVGAAAAAGAGDYNLTSFSQLLQLTKEEKGGSTCRNEGFLQTAEGLKPELFTKKAAVLETLDGPDYRQRRLGRGDVLCLDFGTHLVGKVTLKFGYSGSHPDAPAWLRLKFAERKCELRENAEDYRGWISMGWIQQEQIHLDVLPGTLALPRRYAFRYLQIEVLDVSSKYRLTLEDAWCLATTSADDGKLESYTADPETAELDAVACRTLRSCMQDVFEDGPKRDRRLWMGDLRMQALANYETFRQNDLVKRCLYLFAGTTLEGGRVGACLFTQPEIQVDDTVMFDYSLFFIPTLLDYYNASGDRKTLEELAPTALNQLKLVQPYFDQGGLVMDSDVLGWCFVDWNLNLNKQASAQGIYLYCLKAAMEIARILEKDTQALEEDYRKKQAAAEALWDPEQGFYVSGEDRQTSWASQVWMTLGGARHGTARLLSRLEGAKAEGMVTPYMYHNYVDALLAVGQREKAKQVLQDYWGGMAAEGADTFWELYNPENPEESPYGGTIVNSYCHAWSCAPAYFLRKYSL